MNFFDEDIKGVIDLDDEGNPEFDETDLFEAASEALEGGQSPKDAADALDAARLAKEYMTCLDIRQAAMMLGMTLSRAKRLQQTKAFVDAYTLVVQLAAPEEILTVQEVLQLLKGEALNISNKGSERIKALEVFARIAGYEKPKEIKGEIKLVPVINVSLAKDEKK